MTTSFDQKNINFVYTLLCCSSWKCRIFFNTISFQSEFQNLAVEFAVICMIRKVVCIRIFLEFRLDFLSGKNCRAWVGNLIQRVPITSKSSKFKGATQLYIVKLQKSAGATHYCPKIPRVPGTLGTRANSSPEKSTFINKGHSFYKKSNIGWKFKFWRIPIRI